MLISCLAYALTLKIETLCSSETVVDFLWSIWCYIPEDITLRNHQYENHKFYIWELCFLSCWLLELIRHIVHVTENIMLAKAYVFSMYLTQLCYFLAPFLFYTDRCTKSISLSLSQYFPFDFLVALSCLLDVFSWTNHLVLPGSSHKSLSFKF
jgi:hypothetical protein